MWFDKVKNLVKYSCIVYIACIFCFGFVTQSKAAELNARVFLLEENLIASQLFSKPQKSKSIIDDIWYKYIYQNNISLHDHLVGAIFNLKIFRFAITGGWNQKISQFFEPKLGHSERMRRLSFSIASFPKFDQSHIFSALTLSAGESFIKFTQSEKYNPSIALSWLWGYRWITNSNASIDFSVNFGYRIQAFDLDSIASPVQGLKNLWTKVQHLPLGNEDWSSLVLNLFKPTQISSMIAENPFSALGFLSPKISYHSQFIPFSQNSNFLYSFFGYIGYNISANLDTEAIKGSSNSTFQAVSSAQAKLTTSVSPVLILGVEAKILYKNFIFAQLGFNYENYGSAESSIIDYSPILLHQISTQNGLGFAPYISLGLVF